MFVVLVLAYLPLLRCSLCPCCSCWCHHLCRAGVSSVVALTLSPILQWHLCPCCTGIFTGILHWHQSPSSRWHLHRYFAGIVTQSPHCSGIFAVVPPAMSLLLCCLHKRWQRVITCIGTHAPLHPFTAVRDSSLTAALTVMQCLNFPGLVFAMIALAMPLPALLLVTAPLLLASSSSSYPASLLDTAFVALALLAFTRSSWKEECPHFGFVLGVSSPWGFFLKALPPPPA